MATDQYRKALRKLTEAVQTFENAMDAEMKKPSTPERGQRIAFLLNQLTLANQSAMHFTLGYSFQTINAMASAAAERPAPPPVGVASESWQVRRREDCSPYTWEAYKSDENYTVDMVPMQSTTCGCGKQNCDHIKAVLNHVVFNPPARTTTPQPAADATAQRTLEERLTSGKPEDRVIERGELQDAARLVAEGKVQPIEGKDYYVMPETAQRVRLSKTAVSVLCRLSNRGGEVIHEHDTDTYGHSWGELLKGDKDKWHFSEMTQSTFEQIKPYLKVDDVDDFADRTVYLPLYDPIERLIAEHKAASR